MCSFFKYSKHFWVFWGHNQKIIFFYKGNKNEYGPSITSGPPTIASPQPITITTLATATKIVSKEENQINDDESGSFKLFEINRTHSEVSVHFSCLHR